MLIRRAFFLFFAFALIHSALLWGRHVTLRELDRTHGFVGIDQQGRVRNWLERDTDSTVVLSADEVEPVGIIWGRPEYLARLPTRMPGAGPRGGRESPPVAVEGESPSTTRGVWGTAGDRSVGLVNNEVWVVDEQGEFIERQPLGFVARGVRALDIRGDVCSLLLYGASFRPDYIPFRMVVVRPGHDVLIRDIVIEPGTDKQRRLAARFGVMAALRPMPLALISSFSHEPTDPIEMRRWWWTDPYLAGGAHTGWLLVGLGVTALCVFMARRWARLRCATARERTFWIVAVALLGPTGLLWMRLSIPWLSVMLGRTVDNETPGWAPPTPRGTEVFA